MLVLAIDTSTPAVTAGVLALGEDVRVLAERVTIDPRAHGELLTPHVRDALREAGTSLQELDAIVCGVGPGPFTGLRAGMATAAAFAHSLAIPAYPVCGLDAIAAAAPGGEPFLVVTDARRREVYWAAYDEAGARTDGPHVARPGDIGTHVRSAAGHGAALHALALGLDVLDPPYPAPAGLTAVARDEVLAAAPPAPLIPLYLRRPDAVEPGARKRVTAP
ncbi:tRNA (adenosine(37)-N6)-threonylcarbamoyltransferase complex dimerization subunit type 1 TsaB [Amycolatopsis antarctica]|uniref:tRNA (Adenosine(37)-N6)-threonylcarbamoyltransferase complex dimerization subunit type 1 TsaB n=1 Tax=Amycolatopsis antarctica TaxID=1854586 RepID=A0A263D968_9PSEU|nr:tRNA (adenosine(37)-N6)-threonylcarbamoyltransferase complex dimerization subunit type 1 TsaB [Amycolatopsis antarctica]OZM74931.1 tRNA (adenosine(37)-N6)-threonylcarbamoyltransferase complex dimerization subunit type 1 TsaB [Amycolatopsis antarctica]